jgi:hypothetical protein
VSVVASSGLTSPGSEETDPVDRVQSVRLPAPIDEFADEYEAIVGGRDRFLWRWIYSLFPAFTLSSVPEDRREEVRIRKTVFTQFVTLLDDLVEKSGDAATFEELRNVVYRPELASADRHGVDEATFEFGRRMWRTFLGGVSDAPRYDEFESAFEYDFRQSLNAIEYSRLVSDNPRMANLTGVENYGAHNMVMFPYADVDLMHSPAFDMADYAELREIIWELQKLARIGNWITTWERELSEDDLAAGVVVYALRQGVLSPEELAEDDHGSGALAARIKNHGIEERFVGEWWRRYHEVRERDFSAESVDLDAYTRGMETVLSYHLASRGYK